MKYLFLSLSLALVLMLSNCNSASTQTKNDEKSENNSEIKGEVIQMTNDMFKQKVFNYEINKEWKYEGTLPAIVDFYADWCGPCKMMSPSVEAVAREYAGKIVVYKVNTDNEKMLSQSLGIQSLPTLLFVPTSGKPQVSMGAIPKESLEKAINEILMVKK